MKGMVFPTYQDAHAFRDTLYASYGDRVPEFRVLIADDCVYVVVPEDLEGDFLSAVTMPGR